MQDYIFCVMDKVTNDIVRVYAVFDTWAEGFPIRFLIWNGDDWEWVRADKYRPLRD